MLLDKSKIIAGPCSAESQEQLRAVIIELKELGITNMRCGIWKPRSRPGSFEGVGEEGLKWIKELSAEFDINIFIEVINKEQAELALSYDIENYWLGARTTTNPFLVQEISKALNNKSKTVLVKNPIAPDLNLWLGAIERVEKFNPQTKIIALHRGFSTFNLGSSRNNPLWEIAFQLKEKKESIEIYCDPSHIAGDSRQIQFFSQMALDLGLTGLFIEVHPDPVNALSDADQQLNFLQFKDLLAGLSIKKKPQDLTLDELKILRSEIEKIDKSIIQKLEERLNLSRKIGKVKEDNDLQIFSYPRYKAQIKNYCDEFDLDSNLIEQYYRLVHSFSVKVQSENK